LILYGQSGWVQWNGHITIWSPYGVKNTSASVSLVEHI
jgi:hypothetical protein